MARQIISTGSSANDGTGDTLRSAGTKINENFSEIYTFLGGSSSTLSTQVTLEDSAVVFEGSSEDSYETRLTAINPTADRQIQLPNANGTVVLDVASQTLTNKTLTTPVISSISNTGTITLPTATTTLVGTDTTDTLSNKTLNIPTLTNPKVNGDIFGTNSTELLQFTDAGASAVNELTITNATTTNNPSIAATGDDANVSFNVSSKGSGAVIVNKLAVDFNEANTTGTVNSTKSHIICTSGTAIALTLNNGLKSGELKIFTNQGAGIVTITPTNFANGTSVALDQYDTATLIYDATSGSENWYLISHYGATIS